MRQALSNATGVGLLLVVVVTILVEWHHGGAAVAAQPYVAMALVVLLTPQVQRGRQAFVAVALLLTGALALRAPDWTTAVRAGLSNAAFICAFFCALAGLRSVAERAPAIRRAGRFLAGQPPGRRYIALTFGGQVFALVLNYGAIALLGALATHGTDTEPDPVLRRHRSRRMLLAIQRGFTSVLPWSPMSFAVAITTALIPGTRLGAILVPGLVTGLLMAGTGWALDTAFRPKLAGPRPAPAPPEGSWRSMSPLLTLLAVLVASVATLHLATGIRVVGIVLLVVPAIAVLWAWLQARGGASADGEGTHAVGAWARDHVFDELPAAAGEIVLLMMAGYIGTVGAALLIPILEADQVDLSGVPAPLLLLALVWILPAAGQIGMNPILAATLLVPLIPPADHLGVAPATVVVAITAGWALAGVTSPFTATTVLTASFGRVSALHVGLVWNRGYFLVAAFIVSVWVLVFAHWFG